MRRGFLICVLMGFCLVVGYTIKILKEAHTERLRAREAQLEQYEKDLEKVCRHYRGKACK